MHKTINSLTHKSTEMSQIIQVLAIPIEPDNFKIISRNQSEGKSKNGYKQFDINFGDTIGFNSKMHQSLEDIHKIINMKHITVLSLRNCELQDIPSETYHLPLLELDLMQNNIKHVPDCLYIGLQNLEVLNLGHNPIQDFNLHPICAQSLRVLNLEGCNFENVPIWIQEMQTIHLEEFNYTGNQQRELKRRDWPQLPSKMRKLMFVNTKLRQNMLDFFKHFTLLQYLDIGNDVKAPNEEYSNVILDMNQFLKNVSWYNHINVLKLNDLCLQELCDDVCKMVKLKELHLKQNILFCLPNNIAALQDLRVLDVSFNGIYSLPCLSGMQNLEELHLAKNHLYTMALENTPNLRYLDLYDNDLDRFEVDITQLDAVDLEMNSQDTTALLGTDIGDYVAKREKLRTLRSIHNAECRKIGGKVDFASPFADNDDVYDDESSLSSADCNYEEDDFQLQDNTICMNETYYKEDWGDCSNMTVDLVTLSDSEFMPDNEKNNATKDDSLQCVDKGMDSLFIDAD